MPCAVETRILWKLTRCTQLYIFWVSKNNSFILLPIYFLLFIFWGHFSFLFSPSFPWGRNPSVHAACISGQCHIPLAIYLVIILWCLLNPSIKNMPHFISPPGCVQCCPAFTVFVLRSLLCLRSPCFLGSPTTLRTRLYSPSPSSSCLHVFQYNSSSLRHP